jgi:hypothetical protein
MRTKKQIEYIMDFYQELLVVALREKFEAEQDRDKWKYIADRLVNGAERQIDDYRTAKPTNPYWTEAWSLYDKAVRGE